MELIYWDHTLNNVVLLNLLIVTVLFTCLRLFSGTIAHINASKEILKKDEFEIGEDKVLYLINN